MALRFAGETDFQERSDFIGYSPGLQNSGDLEPSTTTITVTAKPGVPDYTTNLTVPAPPDARLVVERLCLRLQITIDSINSPATTLYYSVHVNGTERMSGNFTSTGTKYAAVDLTSGQFNLGTANTIDVYLWVDANGGGGIVVSVVQLWLALGSCTTTESNCLSLAHSGLMSVVVALNRVGSGTPYFQIATPPPGTTFWQVSGTAKVEQLHSALLTKDYPLQLWGTVATDLNYLDEIHLTLRSEK